MLRLVTEFTEKPVLLLMCDNISCGCYATGEVILSDLNPVPLSDQEMAFLKNCQGNGWMLSMRQQYCPGHAAAIIQHIQNAQPQVVVAK